MQIQKLKLGQQSNDEGSINLARANKNSTLKCKKIIIKKLAKLYESVYCHSKYFTITPTTVRGSKGNFNWSPRFIEPISEVLTSVSDIY